MSSLSRRLGKRRVQSEGTIALRIGELRRLVAEAPRLQDVGDYFHEHLVTDDAFMALSQPASHDTLLAMARGIVRTALAPGEEVDSRLLRVAGHALWHGMSLHSCGLMVEIIYFDDVKTCVIVTADFTGARQHQLRFTVDEAMTAADAESMRMVSATVRGRARGES